MAILEIVTFILAVGVTDKEFLSESGKLDAWVIKQPGFEYRALAKADDGSWRDVVFWENMDSAKNAQQAFGATESLQGMMEMLDMESVKVEHHQIHSMQASDQP